MKSIPTAALILFGAFAWSDVIAQTHEQGHKHEEREEAKKARPNEGVTMKGENKQKMKQKMMDMKCCSKEEQKEPKS